MLRAKGLTVRATIVAAVEEEIIPQPRQRRSEETRLLYVAMTRATDHLFLTWARQRSGQPARSGTAGAATPRQPSSFLRAGPVPSQDGRGFLDSRRSQELPR